MVVLVWTIIIAWTLWQLVNIFRKPLARSHPKNDDREPAADQANDVARARWQKKLDTEGEYVPFEEIR